ncbi:MAG TPA: GNAT family N-acetyltransferase [Kineosporiaceae bacterium]|nr:GNAT family N-acetyltransferase [Kineosporiaceae bacterium]
MSGDETTGRSPGPRWWIRDAGPADAADIVRLVRELAAYERQPQAVVATAEDFAAALARGHRLVHAVVAEVATPERPPAGTRRAVVAGIAVWFVSFSTWRGRHGIWLEDLFVSPDHRGLGLGRALLARLAAIAVELGYERVEWNVLDWNEPAIAFYRRLGAEALDEWTVHRLSGDALWALAARDTTTRWPERGPVTSAD